MQKLHKNLILSVLGCFLLASCAGTAEPRKVTIAPLEQAPLSLPAPTVLDLKPVEWVVITTENSTQVLASNPVIFGLPEQGYKNLASNLNDLRSFIQEQQATISTYKEFYKPANQQ